MTHVSRHFRRAVLTLVAAFVATLLSLASPMTFEAQAQITPRPVEASCFKPDVKITCGSNGIVVVTLTAVAAGTGAPDNVTVTSLTGGVTVTPANFTPIGSGGTTTVSLTGAVPGTKIKLLVEGTQIAGGSFTGADLCCTQTIEIDIPKDVCPKPPKFDVVKTCLPAEPGKDVSCKITVSSLDKTSVYPGNFSLTETLSQTGGAAATITATSSTEPWACTPAAPTLGPMTCGLSGAALQLAGNTSTIDVTIKVPADATGVKNCAAIPAVGPPPAGATPSPQGDSKSCTDIVVVDPPKPIDLSIKKSYVKGNSDSTGTFSMDVKNEGGALAIPHVITVNDPIPAGVTITGFGGISATDWSCNLAFPVIGPANLTCTYKAASMPVAAGAALTPLALNATLALAGLGSPETGIFQNCATTGVAKNGVKVPESDLTNNKACAVTQIINPVGCTLGSANCPPPVASCKQDILFIVDASASINNLNSNGGSTVDAAIKAFLKPTVGKGGKIYAASFSDKALWTNLTGGTWVPITSSVPNAITIPGTSVTNWDDALERALNIVTAHAPKPLVIFITDGDPNAYNDDTTGNEVKVNVPAMPLKAASEAVKWINNIRAAGSPLIAVGFGPDVSRGYLDAAFSGPSAGPGSVDFENSSVIKVPTIDGLNSVMTSLGNQMCGTLSLGKSGGGYQSHTIADGGSVNVNDTFAFTIKVANNSANPINGIVVGDQVPAILSGLAVTSTTPGTTGVFAGQSLTWTIPTLAGRASATLTFTGKWVKTYTKETVEGYTNYAQVTAAQNYTATQLNNMNPTAGTPTEIDESSAYFAENIYKPVIWTNPCATTPLPATCYSGSASKTRANPGSETGECTSTSAAVPDCKFNINIGLNYIPAGSTVQIKDDLTLNGTSVSWPASNTSSVCTGPAPANASFTCPNTNLSGIYGSVGVKIPPGQTGTMKNCITVIVSNPAVGAPFPLTIGPNCATVTLAQPSARLAQDSWITPAAIGAAVGLGAILVPRGATIDEPIACPPGSQRNSRGECVRSRVQCGQEQVLNPAGICVAADLTACPQGQVRNPATNICGPRDVVQCKEGEVRDAATGRCIRQKAECQPPQVKRNGVCVTPPPRCEPPQVLRRGECVDVAPKCNNGQTLRNGRCVDAPPRCERGEVLRGGRCVVLPPRCERGEVLRGGRCVDVTPTCRAPQVLRGGRCVTPPPKCEAGQILRGGRCITPPPRCRPPAVLQNGQCVVPRPSCPFPSVFVAPLGRCVTIGIGFGGGGGGRGGEGPRQGPSPRRD